MKVKILAFGIAKDIVGARKGEMDFSEEARGRLYYKGRR